MRQNLFCFAIGLSVGVIGGLIFAPNRGALTRRRAYDFVTVSGRELYERGLTLAEEAAEIFEEGERLMESGRA